MNVLTNHYGIHLMQSGKVAELLLDVNVNMVLTGPQPCAKQTTNSIVQVPCVFPTVNGFQNV